MPGIQKAFVLIVSLIFILYKGIDRVFFPNLTVFLFVALFCYVLKDQVYSDYKAITFIKAFLGLLPFYIILIIRFNQNVYSILTSLVFLPFLIILLSFVFSYIIGFPLINETQGRYGAGLNSAHLAFLMYFVIVLLIYESIISKSIKLEFILISLFVLLLTGSRGPLIAVFLPMILLFYIPKTQFLIKRSLLYFLPIIMVLIYFISKIIDRSNQITINNDAGFNLSGREIAWEFFLSQVDGISLFGGGLGSIVNLTKDVTEFNLFYFPVPHNEFIRFYMEIGLFGVVIFFINFIIILYKVYSVSSDITKRFLFMFYLGFIMLTFFDNTFSTLQSVIPLALILKYIHYNEFLFKS
uniref:O-antigen ligase family protein n=2 Tax=Pseudomonadati TaxID=3379134 RepID=UPI00404B5DC9